MSHPQLAFIVTTINVPTAGILRIAKNTSDSSLFLVIADRKTPSPWSEDGVEFLSMADQGDLSFLCSGAVPENSYSRKMLGYLVAAERGCTWMRETDDDNLPYDTFFELPPENIAVRVPRPINNWVNVYSYFTERFVWPRGFPLNRLHDAERVDSPCIGSGTVGQPLILQSLADGDPDVDAVYRLTTANQEPITFDKSDALLVPPGTWSPFNSQATTWHIDLLPLMYLPSTCSFRMTDIWRSFVTQALLPSLGGSLVVTPANVFQDRNEHDLMRDFRDEVEGYLGYELFIDKIKGCEIGGTRETLLDDMRAIYRSLVGPFFSEAELPILEAWLQDVCSVGWRA